MRVSPSAKCQLHGAIGSNIDSIWNDKVATCPYYDYANEKAKSQ